MKLRRKEKKGKIAKENTEKWASGGLWERVDKTDIPMAEEEESRPQSRRLFPMFQNPIQDSRHQRKEEGGEGISDSKGNKIGKRIWDVYSLPSGGSIGLAVPTCHFN